MKSTEQLDCEICEAIASSTLLADEYAVIFRFPRPIKTAHLCVAPLRHSTSIQELGTSELASIARMLQRAEAALMHVISPIKVYFVAAGDRDPHFHFHVLAREDGEAGLGTFVVGSKGWRTAILPYEPEKDALVIERVRETLQDLPEI
jgi:diadenosine tetraphosphate (Ap4A) HIT family hydrolase